MFERLKAAGGWLPWSKVMEMALYDDPHGYYSGKPRRIGREGDFYTAVSVGPLYGKLIARKVIQLWEAADRPDRWVLAEQAAHDGQLMEDMLVEIQASSEALSAVLEVVLIEPKESYREVQRERLGGIWVGRLRWVDRVGDLEATGGLLVCNELLDAFPVERVVRRDERWMELGVAISENGAVFAWESREIQGAKLRAEVERLPEDLPEGFVTEIQGAVLEWVEELGKSGFQGTMWLADYGLDAEEYWSVERPEGTLRRYLGHRMDDRVLEDLGRADLTCHVNFTRVHEAAIESGFQVMAYEDQGRFLTRLAAPWLSSLEGKMPVGEVGALLRQFQSLTHPGIMGRSFRVMLLERVSGL